MSRSGISARSLVLLGAFTALALNKGLRRDVVRGTRGMVNAAQDTLEETVLPVLGYAAKQAGNTFDNLREEAPVRVQSLWETAQERAQHLAELAAERAAELAEEAEQAAEQGRKQAVQTVQTVSKRARHMANDLGETLEQQRDQVERNLLRARREAEKELRRTQKHWNSDRIQKEVNRQLLPLQRQASRQLMLLEKEAAKNGYDLNLRAALPKGWLPQERRPRLSGGTIALLAVGVGVVAIVRVPKVRYALLDAVESVSPDAAEKLTQMGRSVREVVGEAWISDLEEKPVAALPAKIAEKPDAKPEEKSEEKAPETDNKEPEQKTDSKPAEA